MRITFLQGVKLPFPNPGGAFLGYPPFNLWLPGHLPCRGGQGRARRGCRPCPRPGRGGPNEAARRAGGPSGSPSGGPGLRAGAKLPEVEEAGSQLRSPLLAAAVAPRGAAGVGAVDSGSRGR